MIFEAFGFYNSKLFFHALKFLNIIMTIIIIIIIIIIISAYRFPYIFVFSIAKHGKKILSTKKKFPTVFFIIL